MKIGVITAKDGLLLRKGPSMGSVKLDLMPLAAQVQIEEKEIHGGWLRVKYNGIWGWAAAEYINVLGPPEPISSRIEWPWFVGSVVAGIIVILVLMYT